MRPASEGLPLLRLQDLQLNARGGSKVQQLGAGRPSAGVSVSFRVSRVHFRQGGSKCRLSPVLRPPAAPCRPSWPTTAGGTGFWSAVVSEHVLRADEVELLREAAGMLDLADRLRETVEADGIMSTGSTGQLTVHPAVGELRQVRAELRLYLRQLDLPEPDDEAVAGPRLRAVPDNA